MGIRAERAGALPYELRQRLGYLSPAEVAANPDAVRNAIQPKHKLHRFVNTVPAWLVEAAQIVSTVMAVTPRGFGRTSLRLPSCAAGWRHFLASGRRRQRWPPRFSPVTSASRSRT